MKGRMTGREIREVLDGAGVLPSKQLGQNFLIDPNMARWIVSICSGERRIAASRQASASSTKRTS